MVALRKVRPKPNAPCLCGSSSKFKKCCRQHLGEKDNLANALRLYGKGCFADALPLLRAHLTQYLISHKEHTEPWVQTGDPYAQELLELDINALSEMLDLLMNCYESLGQRDNFPAVLESLEDAVEAPRWRHRLIYQHALWTLVHDWNNAEGQKVLKAVGDIDSVDDPEILQLYLDLNQRELGFSERMHIIDRILGGASDPVERLQYRTMKGIELLLVEDLEGAVGQIEGAVKEFSSNTQASLKSFGKLQLGHSLQILGSLSEDSNTLEKSRSSYQDVLKTGELNSAGIAMVYRCIGDTFASDDNWNNAKKSYLKALDYNDNFGVKIHLVESLIYLKDYSSALSYLESLNYESLKHGEKFDHSCRLANIAVATSDSALISLATQRLRGMEEETPHFRKMRDRLLLELLEHGSRQISSTSEVKQANKIGRIRSFAQRYLILQPNFYGLGINLDAVLEREEKTDTTTSKKKKGNQGT